MEVFKNGLILLENNGSGKDKIMNSIILEKVLTSCTESAVIVFYGLPAPCHASYLASMSNVIWSIASSIGKELIDFTVLVNDHIEEVHLCSVISQLHSHISFDHIYTSGSLSLLHTSYSHAININHLLPNLNKDTVTYLDDINGYGNHIKLSNIVLGGTFDQLHIGHKTLLQLSAMCCTDTLTIGITSDVMLQHKKNKEFIQTIEDRSKAVYDYLNLVTHGIKIDIVPLTDPFGPSVTMPSLNGLIVSSETIPNGIKINDMRETNGLKRLHLYIIFRFEAHNLSSSYFRELKKRKELK